MILLWLPCGWSSVTTFSRNPSLRRWNPPHPVSNLFSVPRYSWSEPWSLEGWFSWFLSPKKNGEWSFFMITNYSKMEDYYFILDNVISFLLLGGFKGFVVFTPILVVKWSNSRSMRFKWVGGKPPDLTKYWSTWEVGLDSGDAKSLGWTTLPKIPVTSRICLCF